ncbi:MAG TPA: hypothetical protein VEG30_14530 [Terriglobales bacterium]|nr:hypothetical protein [Terriglobales bacterium]
MRAFGLFRKDISIVRFFSCLLLLALGVGISSGAAQSPAAPIESARSGAITFTFDMPQIDPSHYVIVVDSGGHASYESHSQDPDDPPYHIEFRVSDAGRDSLFAAARELNYFRGDFDYRKSKIAFTGTKKLEFASPEQQGSTTYNWSQDVRIQRVTQFFQNLSTTLEMGRHLSDLHKYDKLGMDAELKRMEEMARTGDLTELQVVAPVLEKIAADHTVINIARRRAEAILARVPSSSASERP